MTGWLLGSALELLLLGSPLELWLLGPPLELLLLGSRLGGLLSTSAFAGLSLGSSLGGSDAPAGVEESVLVVGGEGRCSAVIGVQVVTAPLALAYGLRTT